MTFQVTPGMMPRSQPLRRRARAALCEKTPEVKTSVADGAKCILKESRSALEQRKHLYLLWKYPPRLSLKHHMYTEKHAYIPVSVHKNDQTCRMRMSLLVYT